MDKLKALIVDDSVVYRKILADILASFPEVEVVGSATNGKNALDKIGTCKIDFITLDFEMPEMNGLETLQSLKKSYPDLKAIMVSAHTKAGAQVTMQALEEGAFDFIAKPDTKSLTESKDKLQSQLSSIINVLVVKKRLAGSRSILPPRVKPVVEATAPEKSVSRQVISATDISRRMNAVVASQTKCEVVAIGISTGGPNALTHVIPRLPANLNVPVLIVQHMPPVFTGALADSLKKKSRVNVVEGSDGMPVSAGTVYIAPGGRQMKVVKADERICLEITDDPPENNCRPSADYLFRSVAKEYKSSALGFIMTGMGSDGVKGLMVMKKFGTKVIAQDEATCTVFGMPMEAVKAGVGGVVLRLDRIADEIVSSVK